ncbi:MAG TPA: RdgB/HAM1 family non-canonical purine NTP pyrophosphatase [Clostridia bacterium]|nr:RdgB/HAM1 family non-canonical purine NTP pyrophosphatase [Clostridia bacterium]
MDFLLATHNINKRNELARILSPLGIRVLIGSEIGIQLTDVEETGVTFEENALLKAESGCKESGLPCIADDSGLCVDYLNGAPGIYSARFSGVHGDDEKNIERLLKELSGVPREKRTARFVCAACCVFPNDKKIVVRGECEGFISESPRGNGGFGYDPVFEPEKTQNGMTIAQMSSDEKDLISHRGKALTLLAQELKKIL